MTIQRVHPAVAKYLLELELAAKNHVGLHPNQILRDAEEHLMRDAEALLRAEPGLDNEAMLQHFYQTFGQPDEVAQSYVSFSDSSTTSIPAFAANWRIFCPQCGRSAPAKKVGVTRIGARSIGKRILGWCSECRKFRLLRLSRDLNRAGTIAPSEELTKTSIGSAWNSLLSSRRHAIGWLVFLLILLPWGCSFALRFIPTLQAAQSATPLSRAPGLEKLPAGWAIVSDIEVKNEQLNQISKKLGLPLKSLFNTVIRYDNSKLQINTISVQNEGDAVRLKTILRKGKSNPRWIVMNKTNVYEFAVRSQEDALIASKARYALPIVPPQQTYRVAFEAVPIQREKNSPSPDVRNRLFNLLLQASKDPKVHPEIQDLAKNFEFASEFSLVKDMQGSVLVDWTSTEAEITPALEQRELSVVKARNLKTRLGLPTVNLAATVSVDTATKRTPDPRLDTDMLLAANSRFPTDSPEVIKQVKAIISQSDSDSVRLEKLLKWFTDPQNIRYDGLTGSRYGTATVLKQHYGRCWDYSDLFVTMARIAGLPTRQVYGWLYESEGHVWCDVVVDGKWRMVDPTTGTFCGSDYLPFCMSDTGEFPLLYASRVSIETQ